ncbi:MAG: hypothetical protein KDD60_01305 [Bdellovibrionales bacterium]|nr:hypothetical protein [Bdellovibrionales bacterium]
MMQVPLNKPVVASHMTAWPGRESEISEICERLDQMVTAYGIREPNCCGLFSAKSFIGIEIIDSGIYEISVLEDNVTYRFNPKSNLANFNPQLGALARIRGNLDAIENELKAIDPTTREAQAKRFLLTEE